nr:MAG TPA: hypothetical protein [Caudoviricetes sp.]
MIIVSEDTLLTESQSWAFYRVFKKPPFYGLFRGSKIR